MGMIFSTMQLVEYNLWSNLNNPAQNKFWSHVGKYVVWAELFGAANLVQEPFYRSLFFGLSFLYVLVQNLLTMNKRNILTTIGPNKHLVHNWFPDNNIFNLTLPLLIAIPFWFSTSIPIAIFATVTMILSALVYGQTGEFSSMWCYAATFFWFIVIFQSIGLDSNCMTWLRK
jgi:hypothetical protein